MTHSGEGLRITGPTEQIQLNTIPNYSSGGRRLQVRPQLPGFVHDARVEISLPDEADGEMARAILAGLRSAGYEARLFETSTLTAEVAAAREPGQ